jgi:hypothetical protein
MTGDGGLTAEDRGQKAEVRIERDRRERTKARKGKNLSIGISIAFPAFLHALCSMLYAQNRNKK